MRIYAEEKEKKTIKECLDFFPDKESFKTLRYIIDVNNIKLPKTIFNEKTIFNWRSFDKVKFRIANGIHFFYNENISDIHLKNAVGKCKLTCKCDSDFYHIVIHELAHHYFIKNNLYKDWKDIAKKKDKYITMYARKNIAEFFAENYVAFTTEDGTNWHDKNRPDVLYLLEKLWD